MRQHKHDNVTYIVKDVALAVTMERRDIINDYTIEDYRYVRMIPTGISAGGCIRRMNLISEEDRIL